MRISITGGAWITAAGRGTLGGGERAALAPGRPQIPPSKEIFTERVARFGRYDELTKLGCACVALALRDAGLYEASERRPIGIVSSSRLECLETDLEFYKSTQVEGGTLASPNLFSYTLPGIMQGECAVNFKLSGPTLCVGEEGGRGLAALRCAARLIEGGMAPRMLAGWIDCFSDADGKTEPALPREGGTAGGEFYSGAAFVVLEACPPESARTMRELPPCAAGPASLLDFFAPRRPA